MDSRTDYGNCPRPRIDSHLYDMAVSTLLVSEHGLNSGCSFYELSRNRDIQSKLRAELLAAGLDCDVRTLLQLPYLNGVVHESLRLHSTSGQSIRHAFVDDVVPLEKPVNGHKRLVIKSGG